MLGASPVQLIVSDIPELLTKSAAVLERTPLPRALSEWPAAIRRLDTRSFLRLVPLLGCGCLIISLVLAVMRRVLFLRSPGRRTFWLSISLSVICRWGGWSTELCKVRVRASGVL